MTTYDDPSPLQNRLVLITGGARRVGAAIVHVLHEAGANVMIHYRSSAGAANALMDDLNRTRPGSAAVHCENLLDPDAANGLVAAALREFGRIDILVNNASTFYATPVGGITPAQWDDLLGSNLKAPFFLAQAAAPSLRAQRGLIINIVDIHALRPLKRHPVYSIAKAGLAMLTRSLARELGPDIRVNGIAPGPARCCFSRRMHPTSRARSLPWTAAGASRRSARRSRPRRVRGSCLGPPRPRARKAVHRE
jgi:pteridine reductase